MNSLPIIGIFVLMLLVISGYVSSSEETPAMGGESMEQHPDPHVSYYKQHLINMGIERR